LRPNRFVAFLLPFIFYNQPTSNYLLIPHSSPLTSYLLTLVSNFLFLPTTNYQWSLRHPVFSGLPTTNYHSPLHPLVALPLLKLNILRLRRSGRATSSFLTSYLLPTSSLPPLQGSGVLSFPLSFFVYKKIKHLAEKLLKRSQRP